MDFGAILHVAKKNNEIQKEKDSGRYYSTKFAPPKKESKDSKLSENIKKFLQKQQEEERKKKEEEKVKLTNLLAMRDEKSKNKIKKMLKVTKSANKSVLDDVIKDHTAVTLEGPEQPDQDDYGYVSNEANAFYQKYIEKVKDVKEDKGFTPSRPQSLKDLAGTKERVKAAITREAEERKSHTRQSSTTSSAQTKSSSNPPAASGSGEGSTSSSSSSAKIERHRTSSKPIYDPEAEKREAERKKREEQQQRAKNRKPAPPPMDFQALLKLAEKKQHEPIQFTPTLTKKEPERLLTLKEKRELEERQRAKERRSQPKPEPKPEPKEKEKEKEKPVKNVMEPNGRIPKLNSASTNNSSNSSLSRSTLDMKKDLPSVKNPKIGSSTSVSSKPEIKPSAAKSISGSVKASSITTKDMRPPSSVKPNKIPEKAPVAKDYKAIVPRQFPPPDVRKSNNYSYSSGSSSSIRNKKPPPPKRRIIDDDDDEYDSEMDDFIDDGDEEMDYSAHIRDIFGYDRNKYRYVDDDEDDTAMESNFAQVQREEYISKKIGLQEDLEDMKLEALEKKKKMMKKRKLLD